MAEVQVPCEFINHRPSQDSLASRRRGPLPEDARAGCHAFVRRRVSRPVQRALTEATIQAWSRRLTGSLAA